MLSRSGFLQYQQWVANISPTVTFISGPSIGKALRIQGGVSSAGLMAVYADRNAEAFIGWRVRSPANLSGGTNSGRWFIFYDAVAGGIQFSVFFNRNNYSVQVFTGGGSGANPASGTSIGLSANNVWTDNTWELVEIHAKIHGSAGEVEVRVRGETVLHLTGQNTKITANAWFDSIGLVPDPFSGGASNSYLDLDDHYYCDTTSDSGTSANNTFMGDVGTRTLFATGDGSVHFIPNSGANNYSRINETAMDSDTSYNSSATPGDEDQFTFQPMINAIPVIYGVQVTIAVRKDDVGPRVIKTGLVSGGTTGYGANHSLPDTYAYFTDMWILNPDTTANWTRTEVNAALGLYNLVS